MKTFFEKCSKITIKTRSLLMKFVQQIPRHKTKFFSLYLQDNGAQKDNKISNTFVIKSTKTLQTQFIFW